MTFDCMLNRINDNQHFTFTRYGDGEFGIMFNDPTIMNVVVKRHGDEAGLKQAGKQMYKDMTTLRFMADPIYYVGIQGMAYKMFRDKIDNLTIGLNTCNADIIHHASKAGRLKELIEALDGRHVIAVGPSYLSKLPLEIDHVPTPENLVWRQRDYLSLVVKQKARKDSVILWSASIASNMCMFDCFQHDITQIDTGSVFDVYLYKPTRKYQHQMKNPTL